MRKNLLIFVVLLILSIVASVAGMMLVYKPYECPHDGSICPAMYRLVWIGFPFNMIGGSFDPNIMFIANVVFYFLVFSGIYFVYLTVFKKKKKR